MNITRIETIIKLLQVETKIQPIRLNLPIVFQKRYEFFTFIVKNKSFLLIKEKREGSLESFVKQAQVIQKEVDKQEIILVFSKLSDEKKKKLLKIGVPYIDYQENVFIPQLGFLFSPTREQFDFKRLLSPTEQKLLITLLLHTKGMVIDMEKISQLTNLSIPSLYRYFKSFKERLWLVNKQKSYQFAKSKSEIFDEAQDLLTNPIKDVLMISESDYQNLKSNHFAKATYLHALSHLGMIADSENNRARAISQKQYKEIEKSLQAYILQGSRLEIWHYEPIPFDYIQNKWVNLSNISIVDPISLYLTLKEDRDPRIEEEVEGLKQKILNFLGEEYAC